MRALSFEVPKNYYNKMKMIAYPRVSRRMQAFLIDGILLSSGVAVTLIVASALGIQGIKAVSLAGLAVFLLEPALVSFTGATIGHHLLGLCVVNKSTLKNITIFPAIVRFIVKFTLGLPSIIPIFTTRQYQAIHDLLVGSIVILNHPETFQTYEVLGERDTEQLGYSYPPKIRRAIMTFLYNLALFFILEFVLELFLSEKCAVYNQCRGPETVVAYCLTLLWIAGVFATAILCWRGLLLGCRRTLDKN